MKSITALLSVLVLGSVVGCQSTCKPKMKSVDCTDWRAVTLESYEQQYAVATRRPLWDLHNRCKDWRALRQLEAEIAAEDAEYQREMRALRRDELLYARDQERALQRSGQTVLQSKVGIDVHQQMHYGRPRIDLVALQEIAKEQSEAQKLVDKQRAEVRRQDLLRRQQLALTGTTCDGCGCCGCCSCPVPEPAIREPIVDVPTSIPLVLNARLDLNFSNSGYEGSKVVRMPPPREPITQKLEQCRNPSNQLPSRLPQSYPSPPVNCTDNRGEIGDSPRLEYQDQQKREAPTKASESDLESNSMFAIPSHSAISVVPGGVQNPF